MTPDQDVQLADRHHRSGRAKEAEQICRKVLRGAPEHPDALHLLGVITAQSGHPGAGADLIRRAVKLRPDFVQAWRNLGCVLVNQGAQEEAAAAYSQVVRCRPADAEAHFALGLILRGSGRSEEAAAAFASAAALRPDWADAHSKLGLTLRGLGKFDEAIEAYTKAIELEPKSADLHNNLANVLRDKGLLDEAIEQYVAAVRIRDTDAVTCLNLGNALKDKELFSAAAVAYERAVQLDPTCREALHQMAFALSSLNRFDDALAAHRRALALSPDDPRAHEALGATLLFKQDMAAAEASFRRALDLGSESATAWHGLGSALKCLGRFDEASTCFRRALAINPDGASFFKGLVATGRQVADEGEIGRLAALLRRPGLPAIERVWAGFSLGKLLDEADRFDEAFACLSAANTLFRETRANAGEHFDAEALSRTVDRIIETFTPDFFAQRRSWGDESELPVFVVGMPRSGTTLVEQIAASHHDVHGAGELPDISRLAFGLAHGGDPTAGTAWTADDIATASRAHLDNLESMAGGATRLVDKMPGNVFHLGLIATLFPSARVVFCRRDGRDNCLSCYFQQFAKNNLLYSYDLRDCARQFLETERLTEHWLRNLPLPMLEIRYEDMVADQEGQSRRLIEFLGLPWDPACLEFHRTERQVVTASLWQVRQPIYTRSVGRWRHYERDIGPLLNALADAGSDTAT
jgi:tetratricopeptide (TPR) repeat protein